MHSIGQFFSLTPDHVLEAVERSGQRTTGLCYALGSLENRVYEVERDDASRVVAKFYRPQRWSRETILDEHRLLAALVDMEIPVCAPLCFDDGTPLAQTKDGIYFTLFPRTGGRSPDELTEAQYTQLGRLLARIHNVSAHLQLTHRPQLSAKTYGLDALAIIEKQHALPPDIAPTYRAAVEQLVSICQPMLERAPQLPLHGDCHRGNLLFGRDGWFFLDFDDMVHGPAVQDIWLLLPSRAADCPRELDAFLAGYEQFRAFPRESLRLIEALRGLRYIRYAAWIASRWQDPAFPKAFGDWGTHSYWQRQITDLYEQIRYLQDPELR